MNENDFVVGVITDISLLSMDGNLTVEKIFSVLLYLLRK